MRPAFNIAPRVVVYPHGTPPPPVEEGWLALAQLNAHAVFGDGSHSTTRLCAGAVDLLCRQRPGMAVLDVGTGTGILARIARARCASFVVGTDIDPAAIACAKAHAELDEFGSPGGTATEAADAGGATGTGERAAEIGSGAPSGKIHFGGEAPDHWGARFDLVVANILEAPLHDLSPALCRALKPSGVLLISGFTRPQAPALRLTYETAGLKPAGDFILDDWVLLRFTAAEVPYEAASPAATAESAARPGAIAYAAVHVENRTHIEYRRHADRFQRVGQSAGAGCSVDTRVAFLARCVRTPGER